MISTANGSIDLEDACITDVAREPGVIRISFDSVRLWQLHPERAESFNLIADATVLLRNVLAEKASYCGGLISPSTHPHPATPLDLVEVADYTNGKLTLQGYRCREPWYVWEIEAAELAVRWGGGELAAT